MKNNKKDMNLEIPSFSTPAKKKKGMGKGVKVLLCVLCLLGMLGVGWVAGSVLPIQGTQQVRDALRSIKGESSSDKLEVIRNIMENSWYFGKDIEDLDARLTDQAIKGMTDNSEDTHTEYMSAKEVEEFTQSINRNYIGIGVQFITHDGSAMVTRVFSGSPAENAGVQAGDIIEKVDGKSAENKTSSEIKDMVMGEDGSDVVITFIRDGEEQERKLTRSPVSATCYAEVLDDDTIYLQIYQFGDTTADAVKDYLDRFIEAGKTYSVLLDLRDDGGGYLDSVKNLASYFIDKGDIVLKQEYTDGSSSEVKAVGGKYEEIQNIVILVNENTASAAEVMTLALKENRDDVTIVGTTTYGKGTVQITDSFSDGSALKYTTSRWISSAGTWVNGTGITPDETVELPEAMSIVYSGMEEGETLQYDDVSQAVSDMQKVLEYFGYDPGRSDGYFSEQTQIVWEQFEKDNGMDADGIMTRSEYMDMLAKLTYDWATDDTHDTQKKAGEEILNG